MKILDPCGFCIYGSPTQIAFSIVSSPADGRRQIKAFDACRDYINDCLISYFNRDEIKRGMYAYWKKGAHPPVDETALRLLISTSSKKETGETLQTKKKNLFAAKRIINLYEELAGFERRSVIASVEHENSKVGDCWLVTAPSEWQKASNLVSMVTLIFRVVYNNGRAENLQNLEEVEQYFHGLCPKGGGYGDLGSLLPASFPFYRMLMEEYNILFQERPLSFWYPKGFVGSWHGSGGIWSLCTAQTQVVSIDSLIRGTKEKWLAKQPKHPWLERYM